MKNKFFKVKKFANSFFAINLYSENCRWNELIQKRVKTLTLILKLKLFIPVFQHRKNEVTAIFCFKNKISRKISRQINQNQKKLTISQNLSFQIWFTVAQGYFWLIRSELHSNRLSQGKISNNSSQEKKSQLKVSFKL